jgi:serine/threonine-protein kinase
MRALQRDPADRYATALEMREALESYIGIAKEPVRASDLGRTVGGLFASAREQMATKIRAHMQSSSSTKNKGAGPGDFTSAPMGTAVTSIVAMRTDAGGELAADTQIDMGPAGGDTNGPAIIVTPPSVVPRREGRTALAVLVLAVSILALALVMVFTRSAGTPAPGEKAAAATEPSAAAPVLVPPPPVVPPSASVVALPVPVASSPTTSKPVAPSGGARPSSSTRPSLRPARPIDTSFPR